MDLTDPRFDALIARLDLSEKVGLLTGQDFWSTLPLEKIGLRSMVLSDGPSGVRGPVWDERSPSLSLPSASALSSSWNPELARAYGAVAASEARRKGVDVVLGPTINLHRSPLGGRHFEAFSEDPILTAELAAAYVVGVQENGVGATPKHYIANDFETDRFTADVQVADRPLRELYLLAFEKAIVEARAWLVMSAYNSINGTTATESELLETPLNSEWGFDGVVVSDWTAVRTIESARQAQDLAMPGPIGPWGDALVAAVEAGEVDEAAIDRKVRRLLLLAARVGALAGFGALVAPAAVDGVAFVRRAEAEGIVLLRNDGILPVESAPVRIAVIGHNALVGRFQGGGSATVLPERVVSPLDGIREAFPGSVVDFALGAVVATGVSDIPLSELVNPVTGDRGVRARFLDDESREIYAEDRFATSYVWLGGDAPVEASRTLELATRWTPSETGRVLLGFASVGAVEITLDGETVMDLVAEADGSDLGAALLSPSTHTVPVDVVAGEARELVIRYRRPITPGAFNGMMAFAFGLQADDSDPEALLVEAEELAAGADLVVLVVGTNAQVESEGFDRDSLALPGRQDDLARRVLGANARTVVVVNSGSPVELPWSDDAAAILLTWFGGQEYGAAIGDVLVGTAEPGGRLPTTWGARMADVPVLDVTPVDGVVRYDEGIHIGYRAWLRADVAPAFWFGEGVGYTSFETTDVALSDLTVAGVAVVTVAVRNTGARAGKHVVQLYAERAESAVERPVRWLVGFGVIELAAGDSGSVTLRIPSRAFAHWTDAGWSIEPGAYSLIAAPHAGADGRRVEVAMP